MNVRASEKRKNASFDLLTYLSIAVFILVNVVLVIMAVVICIQFYRLF